MTIGDIAGTVDTLEYDTSSGQNGHLINISGKIYVIAYQATGNVGTLKTVSITPAGTIGAIIDTFTFDAVRGITPFIFPISGDIYGIAYRGVDDDGFLKTVDIDNLGNIGAIIDTLEFDTARASGPSVLKVSGDIYIIAHGSEPGASATQWTTVDIGVTGTPLSVVDTEVSVGSLGQLVDIVNVSGTVYALAYTDVGATDNFIQTRTISSTGVIGPIIEDFVYEAGFSGGTQRIVQVAGNIFVVMGLDGRVYTVNIPNSGSGMAAVTSLQLAPTAFGTLIDIALLSQSVYAVVYEDIAVGQGEMQTLSIPDSGTPLTSLDSFQFEAVQATSPQIRLVSAVDNRAIVGVTYAGPGNDGFLETIAIEIAQPPPPPPPAIVPSGATYGPAPGAPPGTILYITPDGIEYPLVTPHQTGRFVMSQSGFGSAPIQYISQRGPNQDGETVRDFNLTPRVVQLLERQQFKGREAWWDGRRDILNDLRPNRQLTATAVVTGTLRVVKAGGQVRDLNVFIQDGPRFEARNVDEWDEWAFEEVLRFVAHDPLWFNPTRVDLTLAFTLDANLVFPMTFPIQFGAGLIDVSTNLDYTGTWASLPTIVITGPIDDFILDNVTTGETLALLQNIGPGRTVTIDLAFGQKTITDDLGNNLLGSLSTTSDLGTWHIAPTPEAPQVTGQPRPTARNVIRLRGSNPTGSTSVQVRFFTRYFGI